MIIYRGSTQPLTIELPFDTAVVKCVVVTYAQNDVVVFEKRTKDCTMQGKEMKLMLSQEDTLKLDCKYNAQMQVRVLTVDGLAPPLDIVTMGVGKCLSDEVLK